MNEPEGSKMSDRERQILYIHHLDMELKNKVNE